MRYYVTLPGDEEVAIDVVQKPGGRTEVHIAGKPVDVDVVKAEGALSVRVGSRVFDLWLEHDGKSYGVVGGGVRTRALVESERTRIAAAASRTGHGGGGGRVEAPMPGRVVKLLVETGDAVEAGAPVVVVEAMKMENELCAEAAGIVTKILVEPGANVESGVTLVELGPLLSSPE